MMRAVSARNQLQGKVSAIFEGSVNNEVIVTLNNGDELVTVITKQSCETLGIVPGKSVIAIIKAPWVVLADPHAGLLFSARNQFSGSATKIVKGAVNSTVHLVTENGLGLTSVITNESLDEMEVKEGSALLALVKASSIMIATEK